MSSELYVMVIDMLVIGEVVMDWLVIKWKLWFDWLWLNESRVTSSELYVMVIDMLITDWLVIVWLLLRSSYAVTGIWEWVMSCELVDDGYWLVGYWLLIGWLLVIGCQSMVNKREL